jgi:hypothetical protein
MKKLGHAVVLATLLSAVLWFATGFSPSVWLAPFCIAALGFGFWFGLWHAYLQARAKRVVVGLLFAALAIGNVPLWVWAYNFGIDARVSDFRERLAPYENAVQEISKRRLAPGSYDSQKFPDLPDLVSVEVGERNELTVTFSTERMRTGILYSSQGSPPPVELWTFNPIKPNWFMFSA